MNLSSFNYPDFQEEINPEKISTQVPMKQRSSMKRKYSESHSDSEDDKSVDETEAIRDQDEVESSVSDNEGLTSDDEGDATRTSTTENLQPSSTFLANYFDLPDYAKINDSDVTCLFLSRRPRQRKQFSQTELLNYLDDRYSSCRPISESEIAKIYVAPSSADKRDSQMTQII